jgi:hypothetical protein
MPFPRNKEKGGNRFRIGLAGAGENYLTERNEFFSVLFFVVEEAPADVSCSIINEGFKEIGLSLNEEMYIYICYF